MPKAVDVSDIKLNVTSELIDVSARGVIGPLGTSAVFNMPFTAQSGDLAALAKAFDLDSPFGGEVGFSAVLAGTVDALDLNCLFYTYDAADEALRVDMGGLLAHKNNNTSKPLKLHAYDHMPIDKYDPY